MTQDTYAYHKNRLIEFDALSRQLCQVRDMIAFFEKMCAEPEKIVPIETINVICQPKAFSMIVFPPSFNTCQFAEMFLPIFRAHAAHLVQQMEAL